MKAFFELPEVKPQKARFIVSQECYAWGCKRLLRQELQILRGNAQYWSVVCEAVRAELPVIDEMLSGSQTSGYIEGKT